jgi:hypothetical protein
VTDLDNLRKLSTALLYEGCMLYPYRASALKNQRPGWTFGSLLPPAYVTKNPGELDLMQAQVLAKVSGDAEVRIAVRFLQLDVIGAGSGGAIERCVDLTADLSASLAKAVQTAFAFPVDGANREQLQGIVDVQAERIAGEVFRLTIRVRHLSDVPEQALKSRDAALNYALLSVNALALLAGGEFISLLDPPDELREIAAGCKQIGVYPVLAENSGTHSTMLISPIILYDFPQLAPESKGDFFDSTEIDEMLALRVLTLSDEERKEIAASSASGCEVVARAAALSNREMRGLHGTFRSTAEPEVNQ